MANDEVRLSDMERAAAEMAGMDDLPLDAEAVRAMQIASSSAAQSAQAAAPAQEPAAGEPVVHGVDSGLVEAFRREGLFDGLPQQTQQSAPAQMPAEPDSGQRIPKDRFDEVLRERDELRRRHDALVQTMLERSPAPRDEAQEGPPADDLNPEVVEFFDPYLKSRAVSRDEYNRLVSLLNPLIEKEQSLQMGKFIAEVVPGFKPEDEPLVVERLNSITDERTRAFYSGTAQGAAALAAVMMAEGAFSGRGGGSRQAPAERAPTIPMRPMADVSGKGGMPSASNDQAVAERLAAMSDEKFAAMRRSMENDVLSYKPEDLLPRRM